MSVEMKILSSHEDWKPVVGFEAEYQVSNLGRVRRMPKGTIKTATKNHAGYERVELWKENKGRKFSVHRLVAEAFIPNPEHKPEVNHLDENKSNNRADNLEWCTNVENHQYGTVNERISKALTNHAKRSKPVDAFDDEGNLLHSFPSIKEASRSLGISDSDITQCCKGNPRNPHVGGLVWKYRESVVV